VMLELLRRHLDSGDAWLSSAQVDKLLGVQSKDSTRVEVVVCTFSKVVDRQALLKVFAALSQETRQKLSRRLGPFNVVDFLCPMADYELHMCNFDERQTATLLLKICDLPTMFWSEMSYELDGDVTELQQVPAMWVTGNFPTEGIVRRRSLKGNRPAE